MVTRPSRGTRPTGREPRALVKPPRERFFPVKGLASSIRAPPSTSPTPCDACYRWPWQRGPEDRAKDSCSVARTGVRECPSSAASVHPSSSVRPARGLKDPRVRTATDQRPSFRHPPAKESTGARTRVHFIVNVPAGWAPISRRDPAGSVSPHAAPSEGALRSVPLTVPSEGDEPRPFDALAGESERLFYRTDRLILTNEADRLAR